MRSVSPSILVVDDNPQNLQVVASALVQEHFEPTVCQGGKQALEWLKDHEPELALLDVSMPAMDGFELCKSIKGDARFASLPILFLTARTEVDDVLEGFDLGAVDYVTKPFRPRELLARIRHSLCPECLKREYPEICRKMQDVK